MGGGGVQLMRIIEKLSDIYASATYIPANTVLHTHMYNAIIGASLSDPHIGEW